MKIIDTNPLGAASELTACAWLLMEGYEVFRNVSSTGPIDLIAARDGMMLFIDVKTAGLCFDKHGTPTQLRKSALRKNQIDSAVTLLYVTKCGRCFF